MDTNFDGGYEHSQCRRGVQQSAARADLPQILVAIERKNRVAARLISPRIAAFDDHDHLSSIHCQNKGDDTHDRPDGTTGIYHRWWRGIGAACAQGFLEAGAEVTISDANKDTLDAQAAAFTTQGFSVETVTLDVTDREHVEAVFEDFAPRGGVDILVTSAAIVKVAPILEFPIEDWERILATNLTGVFHCCQCAGRQMIKGGFGRIINISSVNGQVANSGRGAYSCSKGGVDSLTRLLAAELGKYGVTANAVAPTPVDTPMILQVHGPQDRQLWYDQLPIKRYAKPQEVADSVAFLASDSAAFINGHILNIDGGFMASGILLDQ